MTDKQTIQRLYEKIGTIDEENTTRILPIMIGDVLQKIEHGKDYSQDVIFICDKWGVFGENLSLQGIEKESGYVMKQKEFSDFGQSQCNCLEYLKDKSACELFDFLNLIFLK